MPALGTLLSPLGLLPFSGRSGIVLTPAPLSLPCLSGKRAHTGHSRRATAEDGEHELRLRPGAVRRGAREDEGVPSHGSQQTRLQGGRGHLVRTIVIVKEHVRSPE